MRPESVVPLFPLSGALAGNLFDQHAEFHVVLTTAAGFLIGLASAFLLIAIGDGVAHRPDDLPVPV